MKSIDKYIGDILNTVEKLKKEIRNVILHIEGSQEIMGKRLIFSI